MFGSAQRNARPNQEATMLATGAALAATTRARMSLSRERAASNPSLRRRNAPRSASAALPAAAVAAYPAPFPATRR